MRTPSWKTAGVLLIGSLLLAACAGATPVATEAPAAATPEPAPAETEAMDMAAETPNIVELAASDPQFSTLVTAVEAAGLVETLADEGPYTVFAPTDEAFAAALQALGLTAEELLADEAALTSILTYHVVPGSLMAQDVLAQNLLTTVEGSLALAYAADDGAYINEAQIIATDLQASNGEVHVIDSVLLPPDYSSTVEQSIVDIAVADGRFTTLVAAVTETGLAETLSGPGPFTVFAPTDEAFAAALESLGLTADELLADSETLTEILLYHVSLGARPAEAVTAREWLPMLNGDLATISIEDGAAFIAGTQIVLTDIEASNGIIHVIDGVLLPPES